MHSPMTTGRHARLVLALIVCAGIVTPGIHSITRALGSPASSTVHVTANEESHTISSDTSFTVDVAARVQEPTSYLEIRFQLRRPSGQLIFQRTEVWNQLEAGGVGVAFSRDLADLTLRPGRYPYEIRVRSAAGTPREQTLDGELLVHAPDTPSTPVALVVRMREAPGFDPEGRFVTDPELNDVSRQDVETLTAAVLEDPDLRLALIMSPVILEQWSRISGGYQVATGSDVVEVPADAPVPSRYRQTLDGLRAALATGRLELLNAPYADPDISGLALTRSLQDLGVHYSRAISTYLAILEMTPAAGTALDADAVSTTVLSVLSERDIDFVMVPSDTLSTQDGTTTPGPWRLRESSLIALALDSEAARDIASAETTTALEHVFDRAISEDATTPVVTMCDIGPGTDVRAAAIIDAIRALHDAPWAHPVLVSEAAAFPTMGLALPVPASPATRAPTGYWNDVADARRYANAFEIATGTSDPDAQAAADASLIAQSRCWAGIEGDWKLADRGGTFSSAAISHARSFLDQVSLAANDITLSGPRGDIPLSITNGSTKNLTVTLKAYGDGMQVADGGSWRVTLRPQENFETISVDLQSSLSSELTVELWSSEVMLASSSATIRASYLDRLAVIAGVVAVLLGLLLFIRRRAGEADAGKMR